MTLPSAPATSCCSTPRPSRRSERVIDLPKVTLLHQMLGASLWGDGNGPSVTISTPTPVL
jgi:hypothetical protein